MNTLIHSKQNYDGTLENPDLWIPDFQLDLKRQLPIFKYNTQLFDRHVVIGDVHAEKVKLRRIFDHYSNLDVGFVLVGDIVDCRNPDAKVEWVKDTFEMLRMLGRQAVIVAANHEWYAAGATFDIDEERRRYWQDLWTNRSRPIESLTLASYGIKESPDTDSAFLRFGEELKRTEHADLIRCNRLYYETAKFIVTHSGIDLTTPWQVQRDLLDAAAHETASGIYNDFPPQVASFPYAIDTRPVRSTDKIVVSGHAHDLMHTARNPNINIPISPERSVNDGKRIRLGSKVNYGDPLYCWEDWTGTIRSFE